MFNLNFNSIVDGAAIICCAVSGACFILYGSIVPGVLLLILGQLTTIKMMMSKQQQATLPITACSEKGNKK